MTKIHKRILIVAAVVVGVILLSWGLIAVFTPTEITAEIIRKEWERSIGIEQYRLEEDRGWSLPSEYESYYTRKEIHHYDNDGNPVKKTRYYYTQWRWVRYRSVVTTGQQNGDLDDRPYWGEVVLKDDEREGARYEKYIVLIEHEGKALNCSVGYDAWIWLKPGSRCVFKLYVGSVLEFVE
jgi:hypothetical protein